MACTRSNGLLYVELAWDGRSLLALLDTGANASAIDPRVSAQLPSEGRSEVTGTTGTLSAELVAVRGLRLGGLELPELEATRRDLAGLLPLGDRSVDLILGSDAFAGRAVTIDFTALRLSVSGAGPAQPDGGSVPMSLDNGIPAIGASIEGLELTLRIDTGASLFDTPDVYVNVPTRTWKALLERRPHLAPSTHFTGTGASGETIELPVVPVRGLRVGPLEREAGFIIVQPEAGYFAAPDAKGFIGNNALEKLGRVTLDYASGRFSAAPAAASQPAAEASDVLAQLQAEAAAMAPLVSSPLARLFLAAIACLPRLEAPRVVFRDQRRGLAVTAGQAAAMTPEQLEGYEQTEIGEAFYYTTRYGTPVAFVRPLELLGQAGLQPAEGLKLLDFGFGSIGQLRALASAGADTVGVEVDPLLQALYSEPGDTGRVARCAAAAPGAPAGAGREGSVTLVFGQFPAEAAAVERVGGGYDAFV
ncbi:MAG TPA: retropepsin-like aspartic protease, partial [Planctomycetota bacterium]|nr:retropepsin-like aspartic protease [Planctomycetota bacterium]